MWIKEIVQKLVVKHGTNDPYEIASAMNIYVFEKELHDEILGFYKYIRRNKFIYLNSKLDNQAKLFTVCHELGHSVLHPRLNTPSLKRKTLFSVDKIEKEANRFAVELLIPDDSFDFKSNNLTIREVSTSYGVPEEIVRLKKF